MPAQSSCRRPMRPWMELRCDCLPGRGLLRHTHALLRLQSGLAAQHLCIIAAMPLFAAVPGESSFTVRMYSTVPASQCSCRFTRAMWPHLSFTLQPSPLSPQVHLNITGSSLREQGAGTQCHDEPWGLMRFALLRTISLVTLFHFLQITQRHFTHSRCQ